MTYLYLLFTLVTASILSSAQIWAEDIEAVPKQILIIEFQPGNEDSASNEFVELFNPSTEELELEGFSLKYRSKSGSTWATKSELDGKLAPGGRLVAASYDLPEQDQLELKSGLAGAGGHLAVFYGEEIVDMTSWGVAEFAQVEPVGAPLDMQSVKRLLDEDGYFIDTGNASTDFILSENPSPQSRGYIYKATETDVVPDSVVVDADASADQTVQPDALNSGEVEESVVQEASSERLVISEIMPDPKSPLTDDEHEYVEIHNPNDFTVNLAGYRLEAGSDWRYGFTLTDYALEPGEYFSLYRSDSKITLSNSGGGVRLLGANKVVDQIVYEKAKAGKSWALQSDGSFAWTAPTPNTANVQEAAASNTDLTDSNQQGRVADTTKLSKKDVDFGSGTVSSNDESETSAQQGTFTEFESESKTSNWVLAGVGSLAVLYGVYEYRNDIRLQVHKCGRYYQVWRKNRQAAKT